jgi:uncharacterized protein YaaQ
MKMIMAILQDDDSESVSQALHEIGLCVNRIASTGGFLRQGSSTLMVGVDDDQIDQAIDTINENCAPTVEPVHRRATLFVLNVEHFEQL